MDLKTYFQLFWGPAIASAALIALLWWTRRSESDPVAAQKVIHPEA